MYSLKTKRIYEEISRDDGLRVLVDRLWPRGIKKETARLDDWIKEIAPSTELRKEFGHCDEKFPRFRDLYMKELDDNRRAHEFALSCISELRSRNVTLLYAAKDTSFNNASVLREWIERQI